MNRLRDLRCVGTGYKVSGSDELNILLSPQWALFLSFYPAAIRLVPVKPSGDLKQPDAVLLIDESKLPAVNDKGAKIAGLIPEREGDPAGMEYGVFLALNNNPAAVAENATKTTGQGTK